METTIIPVTELELSVRTRKGLRQHGVVDLNELSYCTESEFISELKGFGPCSLAELKRALSDHGLRFKPAKDGEPVFVVDAGFSPRVRNVLHGCGFITDLDELSQHSEQELMSFKGFAETSLAEVEEVLSRHGLRLNSPKISQYGVYQE